MPKLHEVLAQVDTMQQQIDDINDSLRRLHGPKLDDVNKDLRYSVHVLLKERTKISNQLDKFNDINVPTVII